MLFGRSSYVVAMNSRDAAWDRLFHPLVLAALSYFCSFRPCCVHPCLNRDSEAGDTGCLDARPGMPRGERLDTARESRPQARAVRLASPPRFS